MIGRKQEIERIIQILIRRTKNNPFSSASQASENRQLQKGWHSGLRRNIPELLKNKRVVSLDLAGMVAGAKYRGEFEERFKSSSERADPDRNVIFCLSTSCIPLWAQAQQKVLLMRRIC